MAEGLPEGLVRNREGVTAVEEGLDRVDAEQVAACWQIYSSNRNVLAENIGQRLENFFWRIWSSERLRQRLSGTQVNIQFDIINEGGYIRTTPTSSPRSSKSLSAYYKEARRRTPPTTPPAAESPKQATPPTEPSTSPGKVNIEQGSATIVREDVSRTNEKLRNSKPLSGQSVSRDKPVRPRQSSLPAVENLREAESSSTHTDCEDASITPTPTSPLALLGKSEEASKENRRTTQTANWRPPILKKESSGSSRSSRNARIAFPSSAGPSGGAALGSKNAVSVADEIGIPTQTKPGSVRRPTATRFNEEVAVSIPKPSTSLPRAPGERLSRSGAESSQKPAKRNPVVVASSAVSKTKPTFTRQRSIVGSSKDVPSRSSSYQNLTRSPRIVSGTTIAEPQSDLRSRQVSEPSSSRRARAASPHPSRQRTKPSPEPSSNKEQPEESDTERTETQDVPQASPADKKPGKDTKGESSGKSIGATKPLVDPNFRAKFIDKARTSQRSLTDLSAFARKSSTAVPTSASYQASGMMESVQATSSAGRGKGREAFTNVTAPLKAPAPAGPETGTDDSEEPLPRTKSQLTLLLEKEKARSQGQERKNRKTDP